MNKEYNTYGLIANAVATNANDEVAYADTVNTFVGAGLASARDPITEPTNTNRTILKITNTNRLEPIKGKAYYDKTEEKIKIEVTYNKNAITKIIDKTGNIIAENSTVADSGDEIIGNGFYKYNVIDSVGNIREITLNITDLDIYIIANEEDLKFFRDAVNDGKTTEKTKAYQIANVKMNEGKYTIDEDSKDIIFAEDAEKWIPINGYKGQYYGQDYSISGIYINTNNDYQGLFGKYNGDTITNLKIEKSKIISTNNYIGGIVGYVNSTNFNMSNCYSEAHIQGLGYVGGIVGEINSSAGKINIVNCHNKALIQGDYNVGGIIGRLAGSGSVDISKCCNTGTINGSGSGTNNGTGGIVGYIDISVYQSKNGTFNMSQSYNKGNIIGNYYAGGMVGFLHISSNGGNIANATIDSCYNVGKITKSISTSKGPTGGIIGEGIANILNKGKKSYIKIANCYNAGEISGKYFVGGISGRQEVDSYSEKSGTINSTTNMCYNIGMINGTSYIGGITGNEEIASTLGNITVSSCYYEIGTASYGRNNGNNSGCTATTRNNIILQIESLSAFVEDTENINNGYPILAWQVE